MFKHMRFAAVIASACVLSACETPREKMNRVNVSIASQAGLEDEIYRKMDSREISLVEGYTQLSRLTRYSTGHEEKMLMNFIIKSAYQADREGLSRVDFDRLNQPQRDLFVAQMMSRSVSGGGGGYIPSPSSSNVTTSRPQLPTVTRCNTVGGILSCSTF